METGPQVVHVYIHIQMFTSEGWTEDSYNEGGLNWKGRYLAPLIPAVAAHGTPSNSV